LTLLSTVLSRFGFVWTTGSEGEGGGDESGGNCDGDDGGWEGGASGEGGDDERESGEMGGSRKGGAVGVKF